MTNYRLQKRLASKVAGVGKTRVRIDASAKEDLKEAITRADVASLIREGIIEVKRARGVSRHRARKRHLQRKKGRQRGYGTRKGRATARTPPKRAWINKIRLLRSTLKELKDAGKLESRIYRELYRKAKGNFFRSRKHLLTYVEQHKLVKEVKK